MKINKKIFIIAGALLILIAAGIVVSLLCRKESKTVSIAFYRVSEQQEEIIKGILSDSVKGNENTELKFLDLNNDLAIVPQAKKADIVFTPVGLSADKAAASVPEKKYPEVFFDSSIIAGTSMTAAEFALKTKGSGNGKVSQVPLFFDGYEMLISIRALSESKTETISSWTDIENLAAKTKSTSLGIAFAGGDDDTLLGILSILVEAFDGSQKYNELIEKIRSSESSAEDLFNSLYSENEAFHDALNRIAGWKRKNIFNTELLNKNNEDFLSIVEQTRTSIIFMQLSEHRKLPVETAKYLTTLPIHSNESNFYFPSMRPLNTRSAIASAVAMISLSDSKKAKDTVKVLLEKEAQENLAFTTGLAPFNASCKIPDMQSDDLRFWIAATASPSVPMGQAAFDDSSKKSAFAGAVRNWIKASN